MKHGVSVACDLVASSAEPNRILCRKHLQRLVYPLCPRSCLLKTLKITHFSIFTDGSPLIGTTLDKDCQTIDRLSAVHRKGKSAYAIRSKTPQHHGCWASLTHRLLGLEDRDRIEYPVLSSDGSAIAGVESFWEAKCNIWSSCGVEYTRNYSYKVWTAAKPAQPEITNLAPSGTSRRFTGRVDSVVYAKNADHHYLLVVAYEEAKYRDTFETDIDRDPNYSVRQLFLNPRVDQ